MSGSVEAQSDVVGSSGRSRLGRIPGRSARTARTPPWLTATLRALWIAVGAVLTVGPFVSSAALVVLVAIGLILTGIVELTGPWRAAGFVWLAAGLTVSVWPGATVRGVAIVAGLAMIVGAAPMVLRADPISLVMAGASFTAGVTLLIWPGVTVFITAMAFGVRTVLIGLATAQHRWRVAVASVVTVVLAAAGVWTQVILPRADGFYAAPGNVPSTPGVLLRNERLSRGAPAGATAWRILYTTTRDDHTPAIASALVVRADLVLPGKHPVIVWAHGATGIAPGCAPSLLDDPLGGGAMPGLDQALARGWVVVAPDYTGLGTSGPHPFLIGQGEARSVLDAVRAARHLSGVSLGEQTVVWGHSQGGNAALWAGILAPSYAPDAHVIGVAALAPGSELTDLARIWGGAGKAIFGAYLVEAYSQTYVNVDMRTYVRPIATIPVSELAGRCLSEPKLYLSGTNALLLGQSIWATDPASGAFGARLKQNTPTGPISVPVLVAQGAADDVVTPTAQDEYVQGRCTGGGRVDYRTYPGLDHVGLIARDSPVIPELVQWSQDRLDGRPAASTCPA